MTVSNTQTRVSYLGDAVTTIYPIPYIFIKSTDVDVYADGVLLAAGYTITGGAGLSGSVVFAVAPALNVEIVIVRDTDLLQETDIPPNDPFPADTVERMSDKLTLIAQEQATDLGGALKLPPYAVISGFELPYPLTPGLFWRNNSTGDGIEYFDLSGSGSAADLIIRLADPSDGNGIDMVANSIRWVDTLAALRLLDKTKVSPRAYVGGGASLGDGLGGTFRYDASDTTSADNGASIIVANDGARWKLIDNFIRTAIITGTTAAASNSSLHAFSVPSFAAILDLSVVVTAVSGVKLSRPLGNPLYNFGAWIDGTNIRVFVDSAAASVASRPFVASITYSVKV